MHRCFHGTATIYMHFDMQPRLKYVGCPPKCSPTSRKYKTSTSLRPGPYLTDIHNAIDPGKSPQ